MTYRCAFLALPLLTGIGLGPANAQVNANCANPTSQAEMNICARIAYEQADVELNKVYKQAIASMKDMDANLPPELRGGEKALREAQRAWIPYRDKGCEAAGFQARGGSMEPMIVGMCLADVTRNRTNELKELAGGLGN